MVAGPHRSRLAPSDARAEAAAFAQLAERARNLAPRQTNPDDDMSAANFFIPSLPGQPADSSVTMYGGHIPSAPVKNGVKDTDSDAHLYFFMVRNRHIAETERTLLWFNGGPGCSSFDGGLMEIGPFRILPSSGGQLKEVEGAWNEYANVIFIDQPVGTGYSYMATNSYVHELPEAAEHVVEFLWKFYRVFPEFVNHDTYIAGESYAGQYIPYIAKAILESSRIATKLKGLLIGNGWIDPYNQYPAYYDFAIDAGVIKPGSGADTKVKKMVTECMMMLNKKGGAKNTRIHEGLCERILGGITDSTIQAVNGQNMCVNNYDVRLTDTHPACGMNWPPDLFDMHPYLSREDVKSAFHASRHSAPWSECNGQVGAQFYTQSSQPSVHLLPDLLGKVPILMFAGAEDLICNHVGIERMIENLNWNGGVGFGNATVDDWVVNGKQAGTWTTARNLTYVKINEASHMVPYDQPLAAHDMFLRFIGVSLISAAGPAAQVPSRVGTEQEAVLGSTHPNGTALLLDGSSSSSSSDAAAAGQKEVLLADGTTGGESGKAGEGKGLGGDGALEGLVHASSALVLVALMGAAFALFLWFRRRTQRLSRSGEGWGSLGGGGGVGGKLGRHERARSLGRGGGEGLGGAEDSEEFEGGGGHELDELMKGKGGVSRVRVGGGGDYRDEDDEKGLAGGRRRRDEEEEIFGLGGEEESDDEEEGGVARGKQRSD
ncbi:hypothetical protein JCM8547_003456 [Rhodosporidiobolus lusitaniae]